MEIENKRTREILGITRRKTELRREREIVKTEGEGNKAI